MLYDAVKIIHDVISKAIPFPDTAKFMFVGVRNDHMIKLNKSDLERYIEYVQSVAIYKNI